MVEAVVIARDGAELGTFSPGEIPDLVESGEIVATDLAWHEGMEDWKPVSSLPQFSDLFAAPPTATIISGPAVSPVVSPGAKPGVAPSGAAITSLVLGIVGIVVCLAPLTAIPAVVFGHVARSRIKKSNGALSGSGMAVAGLVLGYLGAALVLVSLIGALISDGEGNPEESQPIQTEQARDPSLLPPVRIWGSERRFPKRHAHVAAVSHNSIVPFQTRISAIKPIWRIASCRKSRSDAPTAGNT